MRFLKNYQFYIFQTALILIIYSLLFPSIISHFADDPGLGWHLKTGETIYQSQQIPKFDQFLYSETSRTWISDQWLGDLMLYILYKLGEFPLLYAFLISIFIFTLTAIIYPKLAKEENAVIFILLTLLYAAILASGHFVLRPVVFSFLLFSIVYSSIDNWHKSNYLNKSIWLLPLIFILWANIHPSFMLGLALLAISCISIVIDKFYFQKEIESTTVNKSVYLIIFCFIASLINPYFASLHESIFLLTQSEFYMNLYQEWFPINIRESQGKLFFSTFIAVFSLLYLLRSRSANLKSFTFFAFAIIAYESINAFRLMPYYAITLTIILADLLSSFGRSLVETTKDGRQSFLVKFLTLSLAPVSFPKKNLQTLIIPVCFSGLLIFYALASKSVLFYDGKFGPDPKTYPYKAVAELLKYSENKPLAVLSDPNWGGFLIWNSDLKLKPVLDDRNSLVREDFYIKFLDAFKSPFNAIAYARDHNIRFILYPNSYLKETKVDGAIYKDEIATLIEVKN